MIPLPSNRIRDLCGLRRGRLVVIDFIRLTSPPHPAAIWRCRCDCGNEAEKNANDLTKKDHVKSCGCLWKEVFTKHGLSRSIEYRKWLSIHQHCYNVKAVGYEDYGGRGITVCERWHGNFVAFFEDMGFCPSPLHTIERIDVNGPYSKENCTWATNKEQQRNKRNTLYVVFEGERLPLVAVAEQLGIPYNTALGRYQRGWPITGRP